MTSKPTWTWVPQTPAPDASSWFGNHTHLGDTGSFSVYLVTSAGFQEWETLGVWQDQPGDLGGLACSVAPLRRPGPALRYSAWPWVIPKRWHSRSGTVPAAPPRCVCSLRAGSMRLAFINEYSSFPRLLSVNSFVNCVHLCRPRKFDHLQRTWL